MARNSASAVARCAALTFFAATATVMPRPIEAGVLGMARTTLPPPQTSSSEAMVVPAMIETTSVDEAVNGFRLAPASRNDCGLTAITGAAMAPASLADG